MQAEGLTSRYEFLEQVVEDKYGRHTTAKAKESGTKVVVSVFDPELDLSDSQILEVVEDNKKLLDLLVPGVLYVIEAGVREAGNYFLVHEACDFQSLRTMVRSSDGLPVRDAAAIAYQLAGLLQKAAQAGVLHSDLSSVNVFVQTEGVAPRVRVARYGFRHLLPLYSPSPTMRNKPFHGTAEYMAPEVCSGHDATIVSDLYALGILMYEMVGGKPPFVSSSPSTTIKRHVFEKPLPLHLVKPGLECLEEYEKVVARLLQKDPKARFQDPVEVLKALIAMKTGPLADLPLEIEPDREAPPEIVCWLEAGEGEKEEAEMPPERSPESAAEETRQEGPQPKETVMFTGIAQDAARAVEGKREASEAEGAAEPSPETRPTEAFDASLLEEQFKAQEEAEAKPQGTGAVPGPAEEEPERQAGSDEAETAKGPEEGPEKAEKGEPRPEDWFVEKPDELPESVFPSEDKDVKKEGRMFWIIAAALAVLVLVGLAVYLKGQRTPRLSKESRPIDVKALGYTPKPHTAPKAVPGAAPVPAKPASPQATMPVPKGAQAPTVSPTGREVGPTPAEEQAGEARKLLGLAKKRFREDNLVEARRLAEEALKKDPGSKDAKDLLAALDRREAVVEKAERVQGKAEKRQETSATTKKGKQAKRKRPKRRHKRRATRAAKKAKKPELTPEQINQLVAKYIKQGRAAEKRGDFQSAIKAYEKALSYQRDNKIARVLLSRAKKKLEKH